MPWMQRVKQLKHWEDCLRPLWIYQEQIQEYWNCPHWSNQTEFKLFMSFRSIEYIISLIFIRVAYMSIKTWVESPRSGARTIAEDAEYQKCTFQSQIECIEFSEFYSLKLFFF